MVLLMGASACVCGKQISSQREGRAKKLGLSKIIGLRAGTEGPRKGLPDNITALSRIARVHLGVGAQQTSQALLGAKNAEVTVYLHPAWPSDH